MDENRINEEIKENSTGIKNYKLLLILTPMLVLAATVTETLVLMFGFDEKMGVYAAGNPFGTITACVIALTAVLLTVLSMTIKEKNELAELGVKPCNAGGIFFAAVSGGLIPAYSAIMLLNELISLQKGSVRASLGELFARLLKTPSGVVTFVLLLVSIPTAVYFITSALFRQEKVGSLTLFGFFPVIWFAACLMRQYFDRTSALNDPTKIFAQMSLVALMMFMLMEIRVRVGKPHLKLYVAAATVASFLGITFSASSIIAGFFGAGGLNVGTMLSYVIFTCSFYAFFRFAGLKD